VGPDVPPFGMTVLFGSKGHGKTIAAINSPWEPVHVIDVEGSSADYFKHQDRLIEAGVLKHNFTRADCPTYDLFKLEMDRIMTAKERYGTLVIDTAGQFAQWTSDDIFRQNQAMVEKQSQVVWGKVRDKLRSGVLALHSRAKLVVLTAHERDYKGIKSPRLNPALIELTAQSFRLVRDPNRPVPDAHLYGARLPFYPPRIQGFAIASLLNYFDKPTDWSNLSEAEMQPDEPFLIPGTDDYDG
jgi:hypothetical protein